MPTLKERLTARARVVRAGQWIEVTADPRRDRATREALKAAAIVLRERGLTIVSEEHGAGLRWLVRTNGASS